MGKVYGKSRPQFKPGYPRVVVFKREGSRSHKHVEVVQNRGAWAVWPRDMPRPTHSRKTFREAVDIARKLVRRA